MTSDDFPAMIYSGTGVFDSGNNTVIRISLTNIIGLTGVMGPVLGISRLPFNSVLLAFVASLFQYHLNHLVVCL